MGNEMKNDRWFDVSIKRPPQNRILLWAHYSPMKDGSFDSSGFSVGVYRFGFVRTNRGGAFHLPPLEKDRKPQNFRILWSEIQRPEPTHFMNYDSNLFAERLMGRVLA